MAQEAQMQQLQQQHQNELELQGHQQAHDQQMGQQEGQPQEEAPQEPEEEAASYWQDLLLGRLAYLPEEEPEPAPCGNSLFDGSADEEPWVPDIGRVPADLFVSQN